LTLNQIENRVIKTKSVRYLLAVLAGTLMSASVVAHAATKEQAVKAGFIYNITKFTVWPSDAYEGDEFNLCLFGNDNLGGGLEALYGKLVRGKPLVIKRDIGKDELHMCHIAFIAKDSSRNIQTTLNKLRHLPLLTVSDNPDFINQGGMVGLIRDDKRVGFEVDLKAVKAVRLNMGAQLLKLAKKVKGLK
jgi:hypothetical protein